MRRQKQRGGLTIIDCLRDKSLLGAFIEDESTWKSWFCFLRATFGLRPEQGDLKLYRECTGRTKWPRRPASEIWVPTGVRGGKSYMISLLALYLAFFRQYSLSKGEKAYILIVSPTKKQAGIIKSYISGFLYDHPLLKSHIVNETREEIELENGIVISTLSSDFKSLRGFTGAAAIVDEAAYLMVEGSKPDIEIIRSLRSRLLTLQGPLIAIGSPYAKRGEMYKQFKRYWGKDDPSVLCWNAPSIRMNPTLPKQVIDRAMREDPEAAKADYLAEFRNDIETYINREVVEACVVPKRFELPPISGVKHRGYTDVSGGSGDSYTLGISHEENGKQILDLIRETKPPFSPEAVTRDYARLLKRYGINSVTGDRYGGEWPREVFKRFGIRYTPAEKSKSEIYRDLLPLINSGQVELLDNETLVNQLCSLERKVGRGTGKDIVDHPPGSHDDVVNVAALALAHKPTKKMAGTWDTAGNHRSDTITSKYRNFDPYKAFPGINTPDDVNVRQVFDLHTAFKFEGGN